VAKLLVVDDNENISFLYEQELSEDNHDVTSISSAIEALEYLKTNRPDLIVLDICMPEMDGIEFLQRLRAKSISIPIILNTGFSSCSEYSRSADRCVVKSGDLTELRNQINSVLSGLKEHCQGPAEISALQVLTAF